jgi:antitoxin VapB
MIRTKIFKTNQSQAVRLSKAVAFPEGVKDVEVVIVGNSRIITPANQSWDNWFDSPSASSDFMADREQPPLQERESFDD